MNLFGTFHVSYSKLSLTHTVSLSLFLSLVVARQFESRDDVHGLQLLEQQLAGVRDTQRGNVAGGLTVVTPGRLKTKDSQTGHKPHD